MPKGSNLGEFEQLVLLGLASAGEEANGRSIYEEILRATGRDVSITAVHVTLRRLEKKGHISSRFGDADGNGEPPRKPYRLSSGGATALRSSRAMFDQLWENAKLHPDLREG